MPCKKALILTLQNNTQARLPANLLKPLDPTDMSNQQTEYQFDITTLNFAGKDTVRVQYKTVGSAIYQTATVPLPFANVTGLVNALNSLGLTAFYSWTNAGHTYISTYNDAVVFGNLTVYSSSGVQAVNGSNTTLVAGNANLIVVKNGVQIASLANGSGQVFGPVAAQAGDAYAVTGQAPATEAALYTEDGDGVVLFYQRCQPGDLVNRNFNSQIGPENLNIILAKAEGNISLTGFARMPSGLGSFSVAVDGTTVYSGTTGAAINYNGAGKKQVVVSMNNPLSGGITTTYSRSTSNSRYGYSDLFKHVMSGNGTSYTDTFYVFDGDVVNLNFAQGVL